MNTFNSSNKFALLIIIILSIILYFITFKNIGNNELIFSGDIYFPFSKEEIFKNFFFLFSLNDYGSFDGIHAVIHLPDNLILLILYFLNDNVFDVQRIYFYLLFLLTLSLSYYSFVEILKLIECKQKIYINSLLLSILYLSMPFLSQSFHGGSVNISFLLSYCLSPLVIVKFYFFFLDKNLNYRELIILSLYLYIISFTFWLISSLIVIFFLTFFYLIFIKYSEKRRILKIIFKGLALLFSYILIAFPNLYVIYLYHSNYINYDIIDATSVYGNMLGGLIYQLKMYFSWAIYYDFNPKGFFHFKKYYFSWIYSLGIILLYINAFNLFLNKKFLTNNNINSFIYKSLFIFLIIFIFFSKGSQEPFGIIYKILLQFEMFKIFRTPDNRFGFGITAILIILIAFTFSKSNQSKNYFFTFIIAIILGYPIYTGDWIKGRFDNPDYDRVISLKKDHINLANFLNGFEIDQKKYILSKNSNYYGYFYHDKNKDFYRGMDILQKIINKNLVYERRINESNNRRLEENSNINDIILIRADINKDLKFEIGNDYFKNLVYENSLYKVFYNENKKNNFIQGGDIIKSYSWLYLGKKNNETVSISILNDKNFTYCSLKNLKIIYILKKIISCDENNYKVENSTYNTWENYNKLDYFLIFFKPQIKYYIFQILSIFAISIYIYSYGKLKKK